LPGSQLIQRNDARGGFGYFESSQCAATEEWRAPSERIRTASEIPIEVDLTDEDAVPTYMKISEKVLHLRRLGIPYAIIGERLGINRWLAMRAFRWAKDGYRKNQI
jgi:hypothetical protein